MTDVDDSVRDWATFAIGTQCDADSPGIRASLAANLADADGEIRGEAMVGLARRGDCDVIDRIVEALQVPEASRLVFDAADEILGRYPQESRISAALARWSPT